MSETGNMDKTSSKGKVYRVAGPDIVSEVFDNEVVILNLATGRYFGLNETASAAWEALTSGVPFDKIAAALQKPEKLEPFIGKLMEYELLVPGKEAEETSYNIDSRLSAFLHGPEVDVYDDLADLIVADPIHDTETEIGWPVRADADNK